MNVRKCILCGLVVFLMAVVGWADPIIYNVDKAIPDNTASGLQDTQVLSGFTEVISSVKVSLHISGADVDRAYNGDFYVTLQHDLGFVVLLNRTGLTTLDPFGYDNNGFDVTFELGGADIHAYQDHSPEYDEDGRLTGSWGVDGRNVDPDTVLDTSTRSDMLANFAGLNANGNWTLFVADMSRNGNAKLDSWGLDITVVPEPATILLLALGGGLTLLFRRKKNSV